jgi:hypothetical protein
MKSAAGPKWLPLFRLNVLLWQFGVNIVNKLKKRPANSHNLSHYVIINMRWFDYEKYTGC